MQVEQLFGVNLQAGRVGEHAKGLEGEEVDVICAVDGLGGAVDGVGDRDTTAEERRVFHIVDTRVRCWLVVVGTGFGVSSHGGLVD